MNAEKHPAADQYGQKLVQQSKSSLVKQSGQLDSLAIFHQLVTSSFGPYGKLKMIQNSQGGHVTLTSTCGRLLKVFSISSPAVKLIIAAVDSHLQKFSDGGLFAAGLASRLVLGVRNLDMHPRVMGDLYNHFTTLCVEFLTSFQTTLDVASIESMLGMIGGILDSKPGCCLMLRDKTHLGALLLKAFLGCVNTDDTLRSHRAFYTISYVCLEGRPVQQSEYIPGVLYRLSTVHRVTPCDQPLRLALVTISMVGDSEEFVSADYQMTSDVIHLDAESYIAGRDERQDAEIDPIATSEPEGGSRSVVAPCRSSDVVISALMGLAKQWVASSIGLVACQKVIDSRVAQYLHQHGVVVLDRLGLQTTSALQELTGATPVGSLQGWCEEYSGKLDGLGIKILGMQKYLHMYRSASEVGSIVLCNRQEECLEELKWTCQAVIDTLQLALATPRVLPGAGAWELAMVNHLKDYVRQSHRIISQRFCCSSAHVFQALDQFVTSFKFSLPKDDQCTNTMTNTGHSVVDLAATRISALKTASDIARSVLQIKGLS